MYCRYCGQENEDFALYCSRDGAVLYENKKNITLTKSDAKFCKECGQSVGSSDLYCSKCGISLYSIKKANQSALQGIANIIGAGSDEENKDNQSSNIDVGISFENLSFENLARFIDIKSVIGRSLLAIGIVFFICLIISSSINEFVNRIIVQELFGWGDMGSLLEIKIANSFDFTLLSNLAKLNIGISALEEGTVKFTIILPVLIILPIITFFVIGIFQARKECKQGNSFNYVDTLAVSLCYGLVLGLISIISARNYTLPNNGIIDIVFSLKKSYSFLVSIFHGLLISLVSQILGYATYVKVMKKRTAIKSYEWLFDGAFIAVALLVGIILVTSILLISALDGTSQLVPYASVQKRIAYLIGILFSIYLLLMGSWGTLNIGFKGEAAPYILGRMFSMAQSNDGTIKISLIKGLDVLKQTFNDDLVVVLYFVVIILVVIFFIQGMRAKRYGSPSPLRSMILPALMYSLIVGILAYLTQFSLVGTLAEFGGFGSNSDQSMVAYFIGFKFMSSFFGSFILTTLSSMAGFFLTPGRAE